MLLNHFYAYRTAVRKMITYVQFKRTSPIKLIGTRKEYIRNLKIESSNQTRFQNIAFLHYNGLAQATLAEKKTLKKKAKDHLETVKEIAQQRHQLDEDLFRKKSVKHLQPIMKNIWGQKHFKSEQRATIHHPLDMRANSSFDKDSVVEIESIDSKPGRIFTPADFRIEESEKSDDLSSIPPSFKT